MYLLDRGISRINGGDVRVGKFALLAFFGTFLFFWMFFMIRQYNGLVCYLFFELPFSYPIG
ncbi:hypothetical protein NIES298_27730 [Microcystis aeruginosa NIES-298]|jgi:hypothetical protein|nr:MAG: hypothetical protein BEV12_20345 [Microcystis aeruginosa CACIAM 03]GBE98525.1 hypothetical protein NIES298_27730 [Microcystis aeruginosa NIES-298]